MKKTLIFGLGTALLLLLFAGVSEVTEITDRFELKLWNGQYYARARMPDGTIQEIKSADDLTYTQWKEKIRKAWKASQLPPELPILFETDDYAIRDPNDGNLVLEWKAGDVRLTVTKKNLPALVDSAKKMNTIFAGMP